MTGSRAIIVSRCAQYNIFLRDVERRRANGVPIHP